MLRVTGLKKHGLRGAGWIHSRFNKLKRCMGIERLGRDRSRKLIEIMLVSFNLLQDNLLTLKVEVGTLRREVNV